MARAAESKHLDALMHIAERAFRRPLRAEERESLLAFYKNLRSEDGLTHEEAVRDTLASVLMSPNFLYRVDLASGSASARSESAGVSAVEAKNVQPLDDYALASRLSYFLWSSMPDETLLGRAAAGDLHKRDVLIAQTRRML